MIIVLQEKSVMLVLHIYLHLLYQMVSWTQVAGCDGYKLYRSLTGKAGSYSYIGKYTTKEYKYEEKNAELEKLITTNLWLIKVQQFCWFNN